MEKNEITMNIIAHIESDFKEKFGIPRQSGLVSELEARIVFEPEYRMVDALRGLNDFSHLWLIWQFSKNTKTDFSPTVRPPRLGGNQHMGVFATRSPFRPNGIGLSVVRLLGIEKDDKLGPVIYVGGADLLDGTPILDLKPYLPAIDSHPDAKEGFAAQNKGYELEVFPDNYLEKLPEKKKRALMGVLSQDPRPAYQRDPDRIYGMKFAGYEVRFTVDETALRIVSCEKEPESKLS